jgi:uncharacterized membrane protein YfcA
MTYGILLLIGIVIGAIIGNTTARNKVINYLKKLSESDKERDK